MAWAHQRIKSVANGSPPIPEVFVALHAQVASQPPTLLSSTFTRMSFCFFLLRLFGHQRKWRISLWIIFALATITGIGTAIVVVPQCQPIKKIWAPLTPGTCWRPGIVLGIADFVGGTIKASKWRSFRCSIWMLRALWLTGDHSLLGPN